VSFLTCYPHLRCNFNHVFVIRRDGALEQSGIDLKIVKDSRLVYIIRSMHIETRVNN
jgi:hypothetical protein